MRRIAVVAALCACLAAGRSAAGPPFAHSWYQPYTPDWLNIYFTGTMQDSQTLSALPSALSSWCATQTSSGCGAAAFDTAAPVTVSWSWPTNATYLAQTFYALPQATLFSQFGFASLTGAAIVPPIPGVDPSTNLEFTFRFQHAYDAGAFQQGMNNAFETNVTMDITAQDAGANSVTFHLTGDGAALMAHELYAMPYGNKRATFDVLGFVVTPMVSPNGTDAPPNWTSAPSNWTSAPSNWTSAPSNWTSAPSNWTSAPSNWTSAPSNWTDAPSNWTSAPSNWTSAPSNWTSAPSNWTNSSSSSSSGSAALSNLAFTATFVQPFAADAFDASVSQWISFEALPQVTVVVSSVVAPTLRKAARKLLERSSWLVAFRFEGADAPVVAQAFAQLPSATLSARFAISSLNASVYVPSWYQPYVGGWLNINFTGALMDASLASSLPSALADWCFLQSETGCGKAVFAWSGNGLQVSWSWPSNATYLAHSFYALPHDFLYAHFGLVSLSGVGIVPATNGTAGNGTSPSASTNLEFVFRFETSFNETTFRQQLASSLGLDTASLDIVMTAQNQSTGVLVTFHFQGTGAAMLAQELNAMPLRDKRAQFGTVEAQSSPMEPTTSSGGSSAGSLPVVYCVAFGVAAIILGVLLGCVVRTYCCRGGTTSSKQSEMAAEVALGVECDMAYKPVEMV